LETGLFGINLSKHQSLEDITFPEKCLSLNLNNCKELNNVVLPKEITEYLDLSSLKSLEGITLPEKCDTLYLNSIDSSDYVLPEKHGFIYFKDKVVLPNY
jgi:hypothetical protein